MARARTSPVTVPERVNAIDMAKSPEFTSRQTNRRKRKRFRDLFSSERWNRRLSSTLEGFFGSLFGFHIYQLRKRPHHMERMVRLVLELIDLTRKATLASILRRHGVL